MKGTFPASQNRTESPQLRIRYVAQALEVEAQIGVLRQTFQVFASR